VTDAALANNGSYVRTGWTATYTCTGTCLAGNGDSPNDTPALAFDGNIQTTRWSTNRFQQDFWNANPRQFPLYFTVDMKQVVNVAKVTMHPSCRDIFDAPGQLDVLVSVDGTTFTPVAMNHKPAVPPNGEACPPNANAVATDTITFPATPARYIQIKATQSIVAAHPGSGDRYWAIGEFNAFP
jgi:F5/8 type C domain